MVGEQKNKKMASVVFHVFSCLLGFIMIVALQKNKKQIENRTEK